MKDIVLRLHAIRDDSEKGERLRAICGEAADEIERLRTLRPEAVAITPERMKIVRDFLTEMLQIARNNGLRSSVSEQRSPLDGFVALGEKQCLEDAIAVLDSEVAKDTIIRNLQDSLPVARCRPGSMWQYELHYAGYWYVKRSHAYRAITAAIQQEHDIRTDREGTIAMLAEALGVEHEPHQTFFERLVEAASTRSPLAVCQHNWVSARNEVITSGEVCLKCHAVRA